MEFGLSTTPSNVRAADGGLDFSKMRPLISQVKELLPDLGDKFVEVRYIKFFLHQILTRPFRLV